MNPSPDLCNWALYLSKVALFLFLYRFLKFCVPHPKSKPTQGQLKDIPLCQNPQLA
jgi:hypothetical protein